MSDDLKLIIVGTFTIAALAWVVTHADGVSKLTQALGSSYAGAVNALKPPGA